MNFSLKRMRRRKEERIAAIVLGCLWLWGCASRYRPLKQPSLSFETSLNRLLERRLAFQDVRGKVSISIVHQEKRQSFSAYLVFDSQNRIRIEGLGFADTPYFFLIADSDRIRLYAPDQKKVLCGEASGDTLFRLTGIQLEPAVLVNLFSGNLPSGVSSMALRHASFNTREEFVEIPSSDGEERYRIWMDQKTGLMLRMEVYRQGKEPFLSARFEDYRTIDGYSWPGRIDCSFLPSRIQLKVKYKQLALNSGITESIFHLQYPPGTMIEDIDDPQSDQTGG
ncbi:MAG: DUF4292 domain-containing protein [bacterium]